jgi:hypothetical protein
MKLNMKKDELFEIFKRKLKQINTSIQTESDLIQETAEEYLERLLLRGHIPIHFVESIHKDLCDEVLEMYRKKTYGHFNLKSFKKD